MSVLDEWEKQAKEAVRLHFLAYPERILALIDLVRKKDEALKNILSVLDSTVVEHKQLDAALKLTEELK